MTAYHHHARTRASGRMTAPFAGKRCARVAARGTMVQAGALWVCDPTRSSSLAPRGDTKWEVDSMAEVEGR